MATIQEVLEKIHQADEHEMCQIADAIRQRYSVCFPEYETMSTSLPKYDLEYRMQLVEYIAKIEQMRYDAIKNNTYQP